MRKVNLNHFKGPRGHSTTTWTTEYGHLMKALIKEIWKFGPMCQTKYASVVPKNLRLGIYFRPCRQFSHRKSVVPWHGRNLTNFTLSLKPSAVFDKILNWKNYKTKNMTASQDFFDNFVWIVIVSIMPNFF